MTFIRTKEDFTCERCGAKVKGNGYTNHCPKCVWAKHVDVEPGDRAEKCGGMMEPMSVELHSDTFSIVHRCGVCGVSRRNKASTEDDTDALLQISAKLRM